MMIKKNRAVLRPVIKIALSFDNHTRVAAIVSLLVQIDKRAVTHNRNSKKTGIKKTKGGGPRGPPPFLLFLSALSLIDHKIHRTHR